MSQSPTTSLFVTSPFLVLWPNGVGYRAIELTGQRRLARISPPVLDALWQFLVPQTLEEATQAGCAAEVLLATLDEELIIPVESSQFAAAKLWEDRNWTRAAFVTFSQLNLPYAEEHPSQAVLPELTQQRRAAMSRYLNTGQYPARCLRRHAPAIDLPVPEPRALPDFDALFTRRCVRGFASTAIPLDTFGGVLHEATENVRKAEESRRPGDPYFLLNSFYAWLTMYVAVQGVEQIDRGLYQYDPERHQLRLLRRDVDDKEISACIQHQYWIMGGGFSVFIAVHWARYFWIYRHSRAYLNLVIQLGEIGQEIVMSGYARGLGGWMTPAVTEGRAAALFGLDPAEEDAMYFMKLGLPSAKDPDTGRGALV